MTSYFSSSPLSCGMGRAVSASAAQLQEMSDEQELQEQLPNPFQEAAAQLPPISSTPNPHTMLVRSPVASLLQATTCSVGRLFACRLLKSESQVAGKQDSGGIPRFLNCTRRLPGAELSLERRE